ncbi:hypothetical protein UA08_02219 [Talaromyces atroroseus]|uniref:Uncharacterized protein n=1 Tax=Talaromyces atroroseus TaxID=1441469 RepID=A0A225ATU2_TALAT|nr:hypothetical protein UA08_02219 [Talaromyces atroroseus]OKL61784.1 hypothetical protein UA08_02219 [Talaromyces atroroseus]
MASGQEFPLVTMSHERVYMASETQSQNQHEQTNTHHEDEVPHYEEAVAAASIRDEEALPPYQHQDTRNTTSLRPNYYILIPMALYTALVVYTWVVICVIARGPRAMQNEDLRYRQYYAARITQSIVSVATLPVISAVCACAAAVFVQNQRDTNSLSLRQVMALADRKWTNPLAYRYFVSLTRTPAALKKFGTSFLYLAMFTHTIGAITYPVQSVFLDVEERFFDGSRSVLNQGAGGDYDMIQTLSEILKPRRWVSADPDKAKAIFTLRNKLQLADAGGFQAQLWGNATRLSQYNSNTDWYAQVPASYDTGGVRQVTPRINSSVESGRVALSEFPTNCSSVSDYFYTSLNYSSARFGSVNIKACLPSNVTLSPWLATDARQDFTEELYLNISTSGRASLYVSDVNGTYRITMNTTAAFFELPNLFNGRKPGDLLANPTVSCGWDYGCINRDDTTPSAIFSDKRDLDQEDSLEDQLYDSYNLLGPLATIAVALFGPGSWFDNQQSLFASEYGGNYENETGWRAYLDRSTRTELLPLYPLIGPNEDKIMDLLADSPLMDWLETFISGGANSTFAETLTRASYLASKALFETIRSTIAYGVASSTVESAFMPSISLAGIIVVSALMGLYMIPLLAMALYAGFSESWTHTLDSFVMLRMGAAIGQKDLPLQIGKRTGKIKVLDQLPGVVRDVSGPDDKVRQLALGLGGSRLQSKVRYLAYPKSSYV